MTFDADQLEDLLGCAELINTGRSRSGELLATVADVAALASRYRFAKATTATKDDVLRLRAYRARLDSVAMACRAGDEPAAVAGLNALLADAGAVPQIASHDGRGPHVHVSAAAAPLADRMAAEFAMSLAQLVVAGQASRVRSCASPTCRDVFVDLSRNRSRRYCDDRTCGNRAHVAAYRARQASMASPAAAG